jgi:hypothetical protein
MPLLQVAYQFCASQFCHLLSSNGVLIPGILRPVADHTTARPWKILHPDLLLIPGPVSEGVGAAALICGGFILTFAKKDSTEMLGEILFIVGMVLEAINMTSVF